MHQTRDRHLSRTLLFCSILSVSLCAIALAGQTSYDGEHRRNVSETPITFFNDPPQTIELPDTAFSSASPIVDSADCFASLTSSDIVRLRDGKIETRYVTHSSSAPIFSILGSEVIAASSKEIISFNRTSGAMNWKLKTASAVSTSLMVFGSSIVAGLANGDVLMLDRLGHKMRSFHCRSKIRSIASDGQLFYLGTDDGKLLALDTMLKTTIWKSEGAGSSICVGDSFIYSLNRNGAIVAVSKTTGLEQWRFDEETSSSAFELAYSDSDLIYLEDRIAYCFEPLTGKKRWRVEFPRPLAGAPLVVGNIVYIPCVDGELYAMDIANGKQAARRSIGFAPWGSPAFANERLYYPNKRLLYIFEPR